MLGALIRWSIQNRFLVLMGTLLLTAWGVHAALSTPLDALPDLSDTQVIIRTEFPGGTHRARLFIFWRFLRLHHLR
jgi:Cu(I)/Ag(I) efflux system membrane protein CusA/SilA